MIFYFALTFTVAIALSVLFAVAYALHAVRQEYRRDRVPALLYHRILSKERSDRGEVIDDEKTYVSYDTSFDEQMTWLRDQGYTTISLDDFVAFQEGRAALPPKPILVTFDDGFMSNYTHAFPVLRRNKQKATIFVTPDPESENFKRSAATDSPMTPEQMREMSENGISIESHAMTHRYLTELEPEVVRWELEESRKVLQKIIGKPVRFLAIPSGAYDRRIKKLAREAGYSAVFCMLKGTNHRRSDRYALRRLVVGRDLSIGDFERLLRPATACQLRFTSFVQNLLLHLLGPGGLDAFREAVHHTRMASFLTVGRLRYLIGGVTVALVAALILSIVILVRS